MNIKNNFLENLNDIGPFSINQSSNGAFYEIKVGDIVWSLRDLSDQNLFDSLLGIYAHIRAKEILREKSNELA